MVDLEESFEEKYNKLKVLALRLKKKVVELQGQVDQERAKLAAERADTQTKLTAFQAQTKALNSLQVPVFLIFLFFILLVEQQLGKQFEEI